VKGEKCFPGRCVKNLNIHSEFHTYAPPDVATRGGWPCGRTRIAALLDEDMSNTPFLLKAVSGLLIAAAAPVYCVWCLRKMSMEGTIQLPQNTRAKLERSFETTLLKYPDKPESSNGS
jgi:hypothetical protein